MQPQQAAVASSAPAHSAQQSRGPPPAPPPRPPTGARAKVVVALHPYAGAAEGELTMEKGDEITVTDEGDNSGWWKGTFLFSQNSEQKCSMTHQVCLLRNFPDQVDLSQN